MKTLILLTVVAIVCTAAHDSSYQVDVYNEKELIKDAMIQSLEKALIMKVLQNEFAQIQIAACNPQWQGKINFLIKDQVRSFVNPRTTTRSSTYIYVPEEYTGSGTYKGKELFVKSAGQQSGTQHAEDIMYQQLGNQIPQLYWINNSPCPYCALHLIARKTTQTVTMNFMHFYTLPTTYFPGMSEEEAKKKSRELSIECMAKMVLHGFQFQASDIRGYFNDHYLTQQVCKDELAKALRDFGDQVTADINEAKEVIQEVEEKARSTPEAQLCQNIPNPPKFPGYNENSLYPDYELNFESKFGPYYGRKFERKFK